MVRRSFGRSLSFPVPTSHKSSPASRKIDGRGSYSLPCRFHPFVSQLEDEIQDLLTWQAQSHPRPGPPARILDGLARLFRLHSALDHLLQHPQARDPLLRRSAWTARLLDDFLRFADAYGSLRSAIVALNDRQSATQSAIRRNDESRIASCAREQRRAEKELVRIAAAVRTAGRWLPQAAVAGDEAEEADLAGVMKEVSAMTAAVSSAAIAGIAELSAVAACGVTSSCGTLGGSMCMVGSMLMRLGSAKRKGDENRKDEALARLEALEECIREVEKMSGRLFKSMVNTRVFLLNILTPCLS